MSIKGSDCSLEHLVQLSVLSGGMNHMADPLSLTKDFNFILQNPVLATDVRIQLILHQSLKVQSEKHVDQQYLSSKDLGNVTKETTTTYEFSAFDIKQLQQMKNVPIQLQIHFTRLDGSKVIRVLSQIHPITFSREEAESNLNFSVLGLYCAQKSARYAESGNYTKSRMLQITYCRLMKRNLKTPQQQHQFQLFINESSRMDSVLMRAKRQERSRGIRYYSAEEDDHSEGEVGHSYSYDRALARKTDRDDETSNVLYQQQNPMFSAYTYDANPLYDNTDK